MAGTVDAGAFTPRDERSNSAPRQRDNGKGLDNMSILDATPEEIRAMQERISRRQSDRRYEMEMDQAVSMACKANRRPTRTDPTWAGPSRESVIVATGTAMLAGAAAILGGTGAIHTGYAAMVAGVALAGAVGEIAWAF